MRILYLELFYNTSACATTVFKNLEKILKYYKNIKILQKLRDTYWKND